jgi:hypothetical protein
MLLAVAIGAAVAAIVYFGDFIGQFGALWKEFGKSIYNAFIMPIKDAINNLGEAAKPIKDIFNSIFGDTGINTGPFMDFMKQAGKVLAYIAVGLISIAANIIGPLIGGIINVIGGLVETGKGLFNMVWAGIKLIWTPINLVVAVLKTLFNLVTAPFTGASMSEIFAPLGNFLVGIWNSLVEFFVKGPLKILDGINSILGGLGLAILQPFMAAWDWLMDTFFGESPSQLGLNIVEGIKAIGGLLIDAIMWPFKTAWNWIGSLFGFDDLGSNIVNGLKDLPGQMWDIIVGGLQSIWNWVTTGFGLFGHSPSELALGIIDGLSDLDIFGIITSGFQSAFDFVSNLWSGIKNVLSDPIGAAGKAWDWMKDKAAGAWGWMKDKGSELLNNLVPQETRKSISDITSSIADSSGEILDAVVNLDFKKLASAGTTVWNSLEKKNPELTKSLESGFTKVTNKMKDVLGSSVDFALKYTPDWLLSDDLIKRKNELLEADKTPIISPEYVQPNLQGTVPTKLAEAVKPNPNEIDLSKPITVIPESRLKPIKTETPKPMAAISPSPVIEPAKSLAKSATSNVSGFIASGSKLMVRLSNGEKLNLTLTSNEVSQLAASNYKTLPQSVVDQINLKMTESTPTIANAISSLTPVPASSVVPASVTPAMSAATAGMASMSNNIASESPSVVSTTNKPPANDNGDVVELLGEIKALLVSDSQARAAFIKLLQVRAASNKSYNSDELIQLSRLGAL